MGKNNENIYLVDGTSLCYRAFYAIRELSTSKGVPTNAVYGVINMLRKFMNDYAPERMVIVFDLKGPTKRHEKCKEYKIHRKPMPDDLSPQISKIKEVIDGSSIPRYELQGYEADDIIATLAHRAEEKGWNVTIITNDKDALQLVNENIKVLSPNPKEDKMYTPKEVLEKYGVTPDKMIELMALMGDSSDNIKGVTGVGLVTASKLVSEYGELEGIYKNIDKVSSASLKEKLVEGEKDARQARELVILDKEVPLELDIEDTRIGDPDIEELTRLYKELEFEKLLRQIMPQMEEKSELKIVSGEKELKVLSEEVKSTKLTAISLAISAEDQTDGIAFSLKENEVHYVSLGSEFIKDILEDEKIKKIGYDLKRDIIILKNSGIDLKGIEFDVMIADYLLDPSRPKYDLEGIAIRHLGLNMASKAASGSGAQATLDFSGELAQKDSCQKCNAIFKLYKELEPQLKKKHLTELFEKVEMPLVNILADMEYEGVGIDLKTLKRLSSEMEKKLDEATSKIYELAGEEFNINSPKQLQVILFEKLGLSASKKTKTGASTDESVLTKLASSHELPKILLEYRSMSKLKSGYYDSILGLADNKEHKIHAKFNQAVTATGRLSSSEPNLQNIPIKTEMGRKIRKVFIPKEKDMLLLAVDYSQVELRILAHLSGDKKLIDAFKKGEDIHKYTASLIFDEALDKVTDKMRSSAKTVNFGITYGMSSFGLAKDLNIGVGEAQQFIDAYFNRYSGVKKFIDETIESARKKGYVTTLLNRRRYIPEIKGKSEQTRGFAERVAVNTPVQGSAADLIKLAMIGCHDEVLKMGGKMIIQVHDELVFLVPEKDLKRIARKVKEIMENIIELKVPLKVNVEAGPNWMDMEEVEL